MTSAQPESFESLSAFYPYYLSEHQDPRCRDAHFAGTTFGLICLVFALATLNFSFVLLGLAGGYACAWFGHAVYEKNRPATFRHPLYSFLCDWLMYRDMWLGRL